MNSIGLVECKNVSKGIVVTDEMLKSAGITLISSGAVCPGKYVTIVGGELSAIHASVDRAKVVAEYALIDMVHQPADQIPLPEGIGHRGYLGIQVVGYKNQLRSEQHLRPGSDPGQNRRIGIDHHRLIPGDLKQMQQDHKGEGKIIHQSPQKPGAVQLNILQPVDMDAVDFFPGGNIRAVGIFPGIAAQGIHREPRRLQRQHRIIG